MDLREVELKEALEDGAPSGLLRILREIGRDLLNGERLIKAEREYIGEALANATDAKDLSRRLGLLRPGSGRPRDHDIALQCEVFAIEALRLQLYGETRAKAVERVADKYNATIQTVRRRLRMREHHPDPAECEKAKMGLAKNVRELVDRGVTFSEACKQVAEERELRQEIVKKAVAEATSQRP